MATDTARASESAWAQVQAQALAAVVVLERARAFAPVLATASVEARVLELVRRAVAGLGDGLELAREQVAARALAWAADLERGTAPVAVPGAAALARAAALELARAADAVRAMELALAAAGGAERGVAEAHGGRAAALELAPELARAAVRAVALAESVEGIYGADR